MLERRERLRGGSVSSRGWIALRIDRGRIDWDEVEQMLFESYRLIAPKGLIAKI